MSSTRLAPQRSRVQTASAWHCPYSSRRRMESAVTYRIHDVPVDGGAFRVGEWSPEDPTAPTVIALHGVTASHMAWAMVAQALPEVRLIAPDLRGRGRSAGLPGPFGMARHAADIEAVIAALELPRALLIGH